MINILILEDDPAKKNRLLAFLNSKKGSLISNVDIALCVQDAIGLLSKIQYDLFIADVVVPAALGGAPHEDHSIELFTQIDESGNLLAPHYSVAISASSQLTARAREFFLGRPWGILPYTDSNLEWLSTVEKICAYIDSHRYRVKAEQVCDIVIVTALMDPEFAALESTPVEWSPLEPLDETQFVRYGNVPLIEGGEKRVAMAFSPRMGAVASAVLVSKAILRLQPRILIMCGICAGLPGKASIGDVIAADVSWDWQSGKYVDKNNSEHFEIGPHQISIDEQTRAQTMLLKRDTAFWNSLSILSAQVRLPPPKLVIGPIATGSSVLADARVSERIKDTQHRNLCGLDMEVYGAYAAAISCNRSTRYLALKAVCDNGDAKKDDTYQEYASKVSAAAALHFISRFSLPLYS